MTAPEPGVVIIGSGLGGYSLAREFRKLERRTPITIVTADGGESYSKPMLSNALTQGKDARALAQKTAAQMAADLSATILTRQHVASIDRAARQVVVRDSEGGETVVPYTELVLAIGADPRPYTVPGSDTVPVHSVNDLDDYGRWRDGLTEGARLLLIGAGLIGCEFANDLAGAGYAVTLVDPAPWPLGRLLPEAVGAALAESLRAAGMVLHLGRSVTRLSPGQAELDDGTVVGFDRALSAIGLLPRLRLAAEAGIVVDKGIVVDRVLRTSDPHVYAIGDCAQTAAGPLPFVLPLVAQARALAATLAGTETPLLLPALPVVVKTPCLPIAVCPPAPGSQGGWQVEGSGRDLKALFVAADGAALGFALSGSLVGERTALGKTMPPLIGDAVATVG